MFEIFMSFTSPRIKDTFQDSIGKENVHRAQMGAAVSKQIWPPQGFDVHAINVDFNVYIWLAFIKSDKNLVTLFEYIVWLYWCNSVISKYDWRRMSN